jgi:hypothetical protein
MSLFTNRQEVDEDFEVGDGFWMRIFSLGSSNFIFLSVMKNLLGVYIGFHLFKTTQ